MTIVESVQEKVDKRCIGSKCQRQGCRVTLKGVPKGHILIDMAGPPSPARRRGATSAKGRASWCPSTSKSWPASPTAAAGGCTWPCRLSSPGCLPPCCRFGFAMRGSGPHRRLAMGPHHRDRPGPGVRCRGCGPPSSRPLQLSCGFTVRSASEAWYSPVVARGSTQSKVLDICCGGGDVLAFKFGDCLLAPIEQYCGHPASDDQQHHHDDHGLQGDAKLVRAKTFVFSPG